MLRRFVVCALAISLLFVGRPVSAQSSGPVYVVQPDDTLYSIAARFNVSINALMAANNITNPNLLGVGQQLVIPGLEGISGVLDTEFINFGDSFHSLLRRTQIPLDLIRRLNHVVSPTEFYVGASLIVPKQENQADLKSRISTASGESLFELAIQADASPWMLSSLNGLNGTWDALPGQEWKGAVERVPAEVTTLGTRSVGEVVCTLDNSSGKLLANVNVDVEIILGRRPAALTLPREAVVHGGGASHAVEPHHVFVVEDNVLRRREVKLGFSNATRYEIVSGLQAGQKVAIPGDRRLGEGMKVKVVE